MRKHRNEFVIARFQNRICIHIQHLKLKAKIALQGFDLLLHFVAQMTIIPAVKGQPDHLPSPLALMVTNRLFSPRRT